jgi:cytochrome c553
LTNEHGVSLRSALKPILDFLRHHPWRTIRAALAAVILICVVAVVGAIGIAWLGLFDVAATSGHNQAFGWFLHFTMRHSVKVRAPDRSQPRLDDPKLIEKGKAYAELRCAPCHAAPRRPSDVVAEGVLPEPPKITDLTREFDSDQLHWIIKHGIKMSAMPAWPAQDRDDEIWALVAYLNHVGQQSTERQEQHPQQPPRIEALGGIGGQVTLQTCNGCHGSDGNGRYGAFPKLAGLSEDYISQSLKDFRSGKRHSGFMQPFAADLTDAQIEKFAAHFAGKTRKFESTPHLRPPAMQYAAKIAEPAQSTRGLPACRACHKQADHQEQSSAIPNISGQPAGYIKTQLKLFRSGVRAGTPDAQVMARMAHGLTDLQIEDLSQYFAALPEATSQRGTKSSAGVELAH